MKLEVLKTETPRVHQLSMENRIVKTVSLTSSSGAANRSIGSNKDYQRLKSENPDFTTFDFRVRQYQEFL
jgi:hypothetical protein